MKGRAQKIVSKSKPAPRTIRFTRAEADAHIDQRHLFCPPAIRESITRRIIKRRWTSRLIGQAFRIASENFVHHEMTGYELLLDKQHIERQHALQMVAPEVRAIIRSWSGPAGTISVTTPMQAPQLNSASQTTRQTAAPTRAALPR